MQLNITMTVNYGRKNICIDGKVVGSIRRAPKTSSYVAHWVGEVTNVHNEVWRVSEISLRYVETRIHEAFANKFSEDAISELTSDQQQVIRVLEEKGGTINVSTSQYSYNTTEPGFRFDADCSAQGLRGLKQRGLINLDQSWRCAKVTMRLTP